MTYDTGLDEFALTALQGAKKHKPEILKKVALDWVRDEVRDAITTAIVDQNAGSRLLDDNSRPTGDIEMYEGAINVDAIAAYVVRRLSEVLGTQNRKRRFVRSCASCSPNMVS